MRINTIVTLGASAAFGILAIFIARGWVNDAVTSQYQKTKAEVTVAPIQNIKTVPVLVADSDLNFGDRLTPQSVRIAEFPEDTLPEGIFKDHSDLFTNLELPTVALTRMVANEPVLDYKISGPGGRGTLSSIIAENMRAVSIRVNDVAGVSGFVVPGDHVDVMITRELDSKKKDGEQITNLLVQNLKVLGTDQNNDQQSAEIDVVKAVTLEVDNQQAQKLILGMSVGKLSLTLKRAGELGESDATLVSMRDLNAYGTARRIVRTSPWKTVTTVAKPKTGSTASVTVVRNGDAKKESVKAEPAKEPLKAGGSL